MVDLASTIFRDFETDGVPASGRHKPLKSKIREWGGYLEGFITAFIADGGLIFDTRANLFASLAHDANSSAWVIADPTVAYNGIYRKLGASGAGSWTRVADLPYSFIRLNDAGAGTPNAIVATSSIPLPGAASAALLVMNIFEANTGPVTIAANGAAAKPLKTSSGVDLASGYLTGGGMVAFLDDGTNYRLLSDVASSAIQAAAEAAAATAIAKAAEAAASAASINLPAIGSGDAGRQLVVKPDESGYVLSLLGEMRNRSEGYVPVYNLNDAMVEGGGTDLSVQHIFDMGDITLPSGANKQHAVFRFKGIARNSDTFETAGAKFISFGLESHNADAYGMIGTVTLKTGAKGVKALYGRAVVESTDPDTGGDNGGVGVVAGVTVGAGATATTAWALQLDISGSGNLGTVAGQRFISMGTNEVSKTVGYAIYSDPKISYSTAFARAFNGGNGPFLQWQQPDAGGPGIHADLFRVEKAGHARAILGTVGAPAWSFVGDTNTGMYSPAADEVAFSTGAVQALRLRSVPGAASTSMVLSVNNNAGVNSAAVTLGAVDSGGAGFRLLRVPN